MSPSSRIRISLPDERYKDLEELAAVADRSVNDEARTLLVWAIRVMTRRANRVYGPSERAALRGGIPPGWAQLLLPDDPEAADRLEQTWLQLRERIKEVDDIRADSAG